MDDQSTTARPWPTTTSSPSRTRRPCPPATTPTGTTPTRPMATTPTRTTPTRTTHSAAPLLRAVAPVDAERFLAEHWEAQPLVVPRAEEGRFDDLLSVRDVERLITETALRTPGFRLVKAGATVSRLHHRSLLAAHGVHRRRRCPARARRVRGGRDDRAPGPPPLLAPARPLLPRARGLPRAPRSGERLLHAAWLAGAARPPRHARGLLAPGRGREALARLRARARAAAQGPALQLGARRPRRARARRHAREPATRSTCRGAGCTRR